MVYLQPQQLTTSIIIQALPVEWCGKPFFSHGSTNSKGVMILINPKLDCKIEKVIADKDGRYIIADIFFNQTRIVLVNIYAPNDPTQQEGAIF